MHLGKVLVPLAIALNAPTIAFGLYFFVTNLSIAAISALAVATFGPIATLWFVLRPESRTGSGLKWTAIAFNVALVAGLGTPVILGNVPADYWLLPVILVVVLNLALVLRPQLLSKPLPTR